ncbi:MAG: SDR family oxidoreductase, partial [bacterium]
NLFSLEKKVAIITGAAKGNGRAIADGYVAAGAIVYCLDISIDETSPVHPIQELHMARFIRADVTNTDRMAEVVERIYSNEKRIDVLVNNAGITLPEASDYYSDDKWYQTYLVNLDAPFKLSKLVARYMIQQTGGSIINITSLAAELGFPDNPAYVAFKGGLKQLSKALAKDWAKYSIRVNNLGPGYFKTEMTKKSWENIASREARSNKTLLGRWGEGDDLVGPAIFLASDASKYMTGQDLYIDGGWLANGL